jgi:hypothetical protein
VKRNKELSIRFATNVKQNQMAVEADVIAAYSENLSATLQGVPASCTWNYDETNLTDDPG